MARVVGVKMASSKPLPAPPTFGFSYSAASWRAGCLTCLRQNRAKSEQNELSELSFRLDEFNLSRRHLEQQTRLFAVEHGPHPHNRRAV